MDIDNLFQNLLQSLFADMEINLQLQGIFRIASVYKAQILRQDFTTSESSVPSASCFVIFTLILE